MLHTSEQMFDTSCQNYWSGERWVGISTGPQDILLVADQWEFRALNTKRVEQIPDKSFDCFLVLELDITRSTTLIKFTNITLVKTC